MLFKDEKFDLATILRLGPILFVALYGAFSFYGLSSLQSSNKWVKHTQDVIFSALEIEKLAVDLETGERGFLLTGQNEFLEPYNGAKNRLFRRISETKSLVSDNPHQVERLSEIEEQIEQWLREIANPEIQLREDVRAGEAAASRLVTAIKGGEGKKILDGIRAHLDDLNVMFATSENHIAKNFVMSIAKRLVDQETGQRGFLLTGDDDYLAPYNEGKKSLSGDIESLHSLIDLSYDRQRAGKNLKILQAQAFQWRTTVAEPAILARRKSNRGEIGPEAARNMVADGRGKQIFDNMRAVGDEMNKQFIRADSVGGELALASLLKAMVDQETGLRGFLLTGKDGFLEPFNLGLVKFRQHTSRLSEIISNAYNVDRARRLLNKVATEAELWDASAGAHEIKLRRLSENNASIDDVTVLISQGGGKKIMDAIRISIARFKEIEGQLMEERQESAKYLAVVMLWVNAAGSLLIVLFASLIYRTNRRMHYNSVTLTLEQDKFAQQAWIKAGAASVTSRLTGVATIEEFSEALMKEMTPLVGAHVGVIYVAKVDKKGKTVLSLTGSYAFNRRKNISNEISLGEGLVGQCALEKKQILLENTPEDYIHIGSGTGDAKPANIIVFPLLNEGALLGVVEFASMHPFTEAQRELIDQASSTLGIIINNISGRQNTEILLQDAQAMSEKLQVQQEELQAANETLEEQAQQLKASEEELNVSNEELLEKQDFLQLQKDQISLAKEELEQKAEDLQLASKYKTEFLANMSHELRTPLNSMLILSKMLSENKEGNLNDKQKEDVKVIHDGGKDLLVLINDIMDLSKVEAGMLSVHAEDVNVASVLNAMENLFAHVSAEKMVGLYIDQGEGLPSTIYSDGQRIEQILKNFLSNAFKFTSEGAVNIKVHQPNSDVQFSHKTLQHGSVLAFSVIDTGIGIPETKQQAIFEAFQQEDGSTSRKYGGTGLGLSISKELAGLLGGEVSLSSEQGKGSTFTLYLPYSLPDVEAPDQPDNPSNRPAPTPEHKAEDVVEKNLANAAAFQAMEIFIDDDRRGAHQDDNVILIIEDDPVFAKLLLGIIRDKGYKGLVTNKGRDGLYLAMHYLPSGILLDVGLPDIDGMAVLDQLKFHLKTRDIPVHVISGRDNNNNEFLTGGAVSFLQKPIEASAVESILSGITETLEGQQKSVLLIEDDESSRKAIERLIGSDKVIVTACSTGSDAKKLFKSDNFDCIILDLGLPDMSGYEILEHMAELPDEEKSPVIVYTGQEISDDEQKILTKYTNNIIIKGAESPERLLDDVSLFLHRVTSDLSAKHLNVISPLHNENAMLQDRKVLLVDDDMRNLFALSRQLEDMGLAVDVASNGEEAIEALNVVHENGDVGDYDLILMDIMMPIMDGYEAMGKIRAMKPYKDIPIIALTAKAMQEDREKCISAGASEYLTKPIDVNKLVSILRIWLYKAVR